MSQLPSEPHLSGYVRGVDVEHLARHMFERQAVTYGADPAHVELAWVDDDVRTFWVAEARSVVTFIFSIAA
jgi:hypothetical protein